MITAPIDSGAKKNSVIFLWLFNPFYYLAGTKAMTIGVMIILISGCLAFFGNFRFDGLLDFHTSPLQSPFLHCISDGIISWLLLSILLFIAGKMISKSRVRAIDVFGTQALSRAPYLFLAIAAVIPGVTSGSTRFTQEIISNPTVLPGISMDMLAFAFIIIISIIMTIWMIVLMYRAFAVSCNVSGNKAIMSFTAALIIGEIISKIIIFQVSRIS